jgi:heme exporter protein CcmD
MIPEFGYAFYIWTSYGVFAAVIAWQIIQPLMRRQRIFAELREEAALRSGDYDDTNP